MLSVIDKKWDVGFHCDAPCGWDSVRCRLRYHGSSPILRKKFSGKPVEICFGRCLVLQSSSALFSLLFVLQGAALLTDRAKCSMLSAPVTLKAYKGTYIGFQHSKRGDAIEVESCYPQPLIIAPILQPRTPKHQDGGFPQSGKMGGVTSTMNSKESCASMESGASTLPYKCGCF